MKYFNPTRERMPEIHFHFFGHVSQAALDRIVRTFAAYLRAARVSA